MPNAHHQIIKQSTPTNYQKTLGCLSTRPSNLLNHATSSKESECETKWKRMNMPSIRLLHGELSPLDVMVGFVGELLSWASLNIFGKVNGILRVCYVWLSIFSYCADLYCWKIKLNAATMRFQGNGSHVSWRRILIEVNTLQSSCCFHLLVDISILCCICDRLHVIFS